MPDPGAAPGAGRATPTGSAETAFEVPAYRAVHHAVRAAGGMATAVTMTPAAWAAAVREAAPETVAGLVSELAVAPLPADSRGGAGAVRGLGGPCGWPRSRLTRRIGTLRSRVQRMEADDPGYQQAMRRPLRAEARRRALRDRFLGA